MVGNRHATRPHVPDPSLPAAGESGARRCWCGNTDLAPFSPTYLKCATCETLVAKQMPAAEISRVSDDEHDFYGRGYYDWHLTQRYGYPGLAARARADLPERCLYWLRTLLRYKLPPARVLELGSAHGGFVALSRWAGFDCTGLELSPAIVDFARQTFDVPVLLGPVENQTIETGSLDAIVLMDVLEHLTDPVGSIRHCLDLLKPDGIFIVQTPRLPEATAHADMVAQANPFLEQLKDEEHLCLFSRRSIREFFTRLGCAHVEFVPAVFAHYDMFLLASRAPLAARPPEAIAAALSVRPQGRFIQAFLDLDDQLGSLQQRYAEVEADRAARLEVINHRGRRIGKLEAWGNELEGQMPLRSAARLLRPLGRLISARAALTRGGGRLVGRLAKALRRFRVSTARPRRFNAYLSLPNPQRTGWITCPTGVAERIVSDLRTLGYRVEEWRVDPEDYRRYVEAAGYTTRYPQYYVSYLPEKSLEHYIAARLLGIGPDDVYVDIASEGSPAPEVYHRLYGCTSYRQDLRYPPGINGDTIGGDPDALPVPAGFASKIALHCSFEHFEGEADIRFIRELSRILRPGGAACIVPLYLYEDYAIQTDPALAGKQSVAFEADAILYGAPGFGNRHGRFYDPRHLTDRVYRHLNGMHMSIHHVTNAREIDPSCYVRFVALISKPAASGQEA